MPRIRRHVRLLVLVAGLLATTSAVWSQQRPPSRGPVPLRTVERTPNAVFQTPPEAVPRAQEPVAPGPAPAAGPPAPALNWPQLVQPEQLTSPQGLSSTLNVMLLLTVLTLAPSILMMTTCFVRFLIVFGLLRQALGTQQLPPNQVLVSLSLFLTFLVMAPVWQQSYDEGIRPYTTPAPGEERPDLQAMFTRTARPLRHFMAEQVERTGNSETLWMLIDYQRPEPESLAALTYVEPQSYDDVPLSALLPAYLLSEIKTAFVIGFQIYLPFLIIDMVVATVLISMGMMMLPPVLVSLPFKLLLFVLIDGWTLTVGMLLSSVRPLG